MSYVLLRSLMKARYDNKCSPHFGLSTDMYCHFTSPIRRYPDLTVHRFIKLMINGKLSGKELKEAEIFAGKSAEKSNENELRAISAERAVEELYKVRYMSGFINEEFDGIVSSVTSFGIFVELPNTCEGLCSCFRNERIFCIQLKNCLHYLTEELSFVSETESELN